MVLKVTVQKESPKQSHPKVTSEAAVWRCSSKKVILEISKYLQQNICVGVFFLIKFQALQTETSFESSKQVFSCEHCKINMNSVFDITPSVAAFADLVFLIKNIMWDGFYYKGL